MTKNSTLDIFIPYWGEFSLLKKTVESVCAQTSSQWRLVIIDDCYPSDEAQQYCTSLDDKRVTYLRNTHNLGITANFNRCIDLATSQYSAIVGCDDILLPQFVEVALRTIGDADFYQPGVDVIDADGNNYVPLGDRVKRILRPRRPGIYSGEKLAASLCVGNWLYFPSIVWKTSTLQRYRFETKYKIVEDLALELQMILDGAKLYFDPTITFQYRRFAESLSSKEKSKDGIRFHEEADVYDHFSKVFRDAGWRRAARSAKLRLTSRVNQLLSR